MTSSGIMDDPLRTAALLVRAAETGAATLDPELEALLAPYVEGAPAMDWEPVVRELGRSLRATRDALAVAEEACRVRHAELSAAQLAREQAVTALQQELVALRTAVEAVFGSQGTQKMKLDSVIACEPTALFSMPSRSTRPSTSRSTRRATGPTGCPCRSPASTPNSTELARGDRLPTRPRARARARAGRAPGTARRRPAVTR